MSAALHFRRMTAVLLGASLLAFAGAALAAGKKIAMVQINQEALFFTQMDQGAQAAAKAAGVELAIFNSNNDPSAQNSAIETYIQQKVDAILVVAIDVNGIKPAITEAKKAGIPVVTIDAIVDGDNAVQVGVDNKKVGEDIGKYTANYIKTNLGGKASIGVVGALNSFIQNVRLDGFKAGIATVPGAKIVSTVDGQNVQDQAQTAAENLISANPNLQIVYATGEPALIGLVAATSAQDATGRVKIVGWDLSAQAIKGIDAGFVAAVVQQDPESEGRVALNSALKLIAKQPVEKNISVPVTIVTKANVGKYRAFSSKEKPMQNDAAIPRVRMENIIKSYGAVQSLRGVNLHVMPGEVLGLVGDNGAGKSTVSKVLSGAVVPDSGSIEIDGKPVHFTDPGDARAHHIEMVYQDLSLCNTVDVAGNLFLGREPMRRVCGVSVLDHRKMHREARDMLNNLGIRIPSTKLDVENLSGGQRQAIAISRAVSFDPKVLIMDEPTAALAVAEVEAVLDLVRTISERGVSVILISHRLQDLFLVCDRISVMYEGQNVADRKIGETNLEEIVDLIVGHKFSARSARALAEN